jgi:hypothetical protein
MWYRKEAEDWSVAAEQHIAKETSQKTEVWDWLVGKSGVCRHFSMMFFYMYNAYCQKHAIPSRAFIIRPPRHAKNWIVTINPKTGKEDISFLDVTRYDAGGELFDENAEQDVQEEWLQRLPWDF